MIQNYKDFVNSLLNAGFSMGGGNSEGIFSVVSWTWNETTEKITAQICSLNPEANQKKITKFIMG